MKHRNAGLLLVAGALVASAAQSQQTPTTPRVRTNVVAASEPAKVTLSMRGTSTYLGVDAKGADVRATLNDMATKADLKLVLDASATGTITGAVSAQPADTAIVEVAKLAGLSVKKIMVPDASAATVTADFGGRYADALTGLPVGTLISDAATGKTLLVSAAAPAGTTGATVYFVHGRIAPGGMRMRTPRAGATGAPGANPPGGQAPQPGQPNQEFVTSAAKSLQAMPLQQRFDTVRALQRSLFDSMTPEEQDQMRQTMGGRGGFGGGRRGGGNNGGGGGQGGQNNGQ